MKVFYENASLKEKVEEIESSFTGISKENLDSNILFIKGLS